MGSDTWLFRGALEGKNLFSSLDAVGDWFKDGIVPHSVVGPFVIPRALVRMRTGKAPAIGPHTGKRCWPLLAGVWRAIAPLMKPWCAEEEVPTAANLNLLSGRELVCQLAL